MTVKIFKAGQNSEGLTLEAIVRLMAQQEANRRTAALADVTNNSGGTAGTLTEVTTTLTEEANDSTNLAQKAATEAAYTTVLDAVSELAAKANEVAGVLNITGLTDSSGGAAADGTIGAITVATTAATTGVQDTEIAALHLGLNKALYHVARLVNQCCESAGVAPITMGYTFDDAATIAAVTVSGGTAASPGLTKVAVDGYLTTYRNNVKTIAAALLRLTAADTLKVRAQ